MLSIENNELLTRVGPGTPMGTLMRYYWQPVCAMDELLRSPFRTKAVKVLGDGWTAVTKDKALSAHFEHTVVVTDDGCRVLTLPPNAAVNVERVSA